LSLILPKLDREKKIPRTGSNSSATGQDKREKDPRDKNASSSDRKPSRDEKESNTNIISSSRSHKDREYESRSSSRVVEISISQRDERSGSRGILEKRDKKEIKEEVSFCSRTKALQP